MYYPVRYCFYNLFFPNIYYIIFLWIFNILIINI
nr:MAG TPA: hypothetical protein [Caudoviricetes sp.]